VQDRRAREQYGGTLRRCLGAYVSLNSRIWRRLPASLRLLPPAQLYGRHVHWAVRLHAARRQYFGTFFLRNRPELEMVRGLARRKRDGASLEVAVLGCSKGAEVYSIAWALGTAGPDLKFRIQAVDISQDILEFAEQGVYSLRGPDGLSGPDHESIRGDDVTWNTCRDQNAPIFERMTAEEVEAMCEVEDEHARVRPWLKVGIKWRRGDAGDPELVGALGPQDIVVANRFLCHMEPWFAERCLRNIGRLVKPGGYLLVSGVDLDVRTRVAREMGWKPVPDLMREIHEGDASLRRGWPLEYWGLEPFRDDRPDWRIRYASVFQVGCVTESQTRREVVVT
jgi:SAM-dependent methyltransferase